MTEWKKEWTEPELIVLVRNKPEEAVLRVCKTYSGDIGDLTRATECGDSYDTCTTWCADQATS
ncbi:MAG: hypothetical protein NTV33_11675 [Coprothermobacterota bacterium]|nr:hypothetical protein [Coprothermobacterota bacterium]